MLGASLALAVCGCAGVVRHEAPLLRAGVVAPVGFAPSVRTVGDTRRQFAAHARPLLERLRARTGDPIRILALSGGGAGGAFGAGALVGWTRAGNRPEFQIVTGVSAGALIAPFAFLGPAWDPQLTEAFSGQATRKLLQFHGIGRMLGGSLYHGEPLRALVDRFATDAMIEAVAAEAAKGRLLLVATTDLDKEQTVTWNLGAIAQHGGPAARRLFRDLLVASSSIPGLFPPVLIRVTGAGGEYDEMHVDGGTTGSLFIAPELVAIAPQALDPLQGASVYVLVNGQFGTYATTTPFDTRAILKRSVSAALASTARGAVEIAASLAPRYRMKVEVAAIPDSYPYGGPLDLEPANMQALFDFASRCASAEQLFTPPLPQLERAERAQLVDIGTPLPCPAAGVAAAPADPP